MFLDGTSGVPATSYKAGTKVLPKRCVSRQIFFFFSGAWASRNTWNFQGRQVIEKSHFEGIERWLNVENNASNHSANRIFVFQPPSSQTFPRSS